MANPTNQETVLPNIVPTSFSPAPEKYERQPSQELRNRQAQLGQGYTLKQVSYLEIQQHKAAYKRDTAWASASPEAMADAVKTAKTARTLMQNDIQLWAGSLDEDELQGALPNIWNEYLQRAMGNGPAPLEMNRSFEAAGKEVSVETPNDTPSAGDDVPIQILWRPEIPADAPRSVVETPAGDQLTLGDILSRIEAKKEK